MSAGIHKDKEGSRKVLDGMPDRFKKGDFT